MSTGLQSLGCHAHTPAFCLLHPCYPYFLHVRNRPETVGDNVQGDRDPKFCSIEPWCGDACPQSSLFQPPASSSIRYPRPRELCPRLTSLQSGCPYNLLPRSSAPQQAKSHGRSGPEKGMALQGPFTGHYHEDQSGMLGRKPKPLLLKQKLQD